MSNSSVRRRKNANRGSTAPVVLVVITFALIAVAIGGYLVDRSGRDTIAEGISIAGIDVGGLDSEQARAAITEHLVKNLEVPVEVNYHEKKYVLQPDKLDVQVDVGGMVEEALGRSREGGILSRLWRRATGGEVVADIGLDSSFSDGALGDYITTISEDIDQDPVDASITPSPSSLTPISGQEGLKVDADKLRDDIAAVLLDSDASRTIRPEVKHVAPAVSTDELAGQYPTYITVDRASFRLRLYRNLELEREYTVAIGAVGFDTPVGLYHLQDKQVDPIWHVPEEDWAGDLAGRDIPPGPENPLKARWMGIYDGAGIHGTDDIGSLGSAASHGCVRMAVGDVIDLYDRVDIGTPIYIG